MRLFSMATSSFTKAALGAEGVGKDINLIVGNGYAKGHADLTLSIIRESEEIRNLFNKPVCLIFRIKSLSCFFLTYRTTIERLEVAGS